MDCERKLGNKKNKKISRSFKIFSIRFSSSSSEVSGPLTEIAPAEDADGDGVDCVSEDANENAGAEDDDDADAFMCIAGFLSLHCSYVDVYMQYSKGNPQTLFIDEIIT